MATRNYWTYGIENGCIKIYKGSLEFKWEPGMSTVQRTRSCKNMHAKLYYDYGITALDISSASYVTLGKSLSAFNLMWNGLTVECWYQGSKVYRNAGAQHQLYNVSSLEAKKSMKILKGDSVVGFELLTPDGNAIQFPREPKTVFYDWIYLQGMLQSYGTELHLSDYNAFTDIQAPLDVDACQARTVCIYAAIQYYERWDILNSFDDFKQWHENSVESYYEPTSIPREKEFVIDDDSSKFYARTPSSKYEDIITSIGFRFDNVYPGVWNIWRPTELDDGRTCVVYTDLLLDDMCAIETLSKAYDNIILSVANWKDLHTSDYAPIGFNIFKAIHSIRSWFKNVSVVTTSITEAGINICGKQLHAYVLCNATNIMNGDYNYYSSILVMGGMDGTDERDKDEWNASQDIEAFNNLKRLPNVHLVTYEDCIKLYNTFNDKMTDANNHLSYYKEYINRMNRIGDSTACFDLQAVRYALGLFN